MKKINYVRGLDGLRAIAIALVVVHHSHFLTSSGFLYDFSKFANSGVDLFFIISGFLIHNVLINLKGEKDFFKKFYTARILRIVPLYFAVLCIAFFILPQLANIQKFEGIAQWPYWTFLSNYYIAWNGQFRHGMVDLSWSLSLEEQFYLFWSFCVYFFSAHTQKKIVLTIIFLSPFLRFLLASFGVGGVAIHMMSITRMDTIMAGVLIAIRIQENKKTPKLWLGILLGFVLTQILLVQNYPWRASLGYSCLALMYACIVEFVIRSHFEQTGMFGQKILRVLQNKMAVMVGIYSYGIYLFHNPIQAALKVQLMKSFSHPLWISGTQILFYLLILIISVVLGGLSHEFYEKWWLGLKRKITFVQ